MSTLLDDPPVAQTSGPSQRLQATMAAARLSFTWLGVRKSLTAAQKNEAADSFGAEGAFISAGKKLIDTSHPAFKAVTAIRGRAISYWKGISLPFPEPGIRLIRQDAISAFDAQIQVFRDELDEAVSELDRHYDDLRTAARDRLGRLFNANDYPASLRSSFAIEHDFPSVEPPSYLRQLNPELYEQECERMRHRFEEAVQLAEQAFLDELNKLIEHLTERLSGAEDGKPKIFRDTAVTNLTEFFAKFKQLNVRSNEELDAMVARAQSIVQGIAPKQLRDSPSLRQQVASQMSALQSGLDQLLVDRPRRHILRKPR